MSLEVMFSRLAVRPSVPASTICRSCRRGVATVPPRQAQSATASLTRKNIPNRYPPPLASEILPESLQSSREQQSIRPTRSPRSTFDIASSAITESTSKSTLYQKNQAQRDLERGYTTIDLARQFARKWKPGDIYSPHDLSGIEQLKWKKLRRKPRPRYDVLDQLGVNPLDHYKNFSIMSEYVTEMGRIRSGVDTGLRPVNQRKMAKAVRRAMGMGLMPGCFRHPELLKLERKI